MSDPLPQETLSSNSPDLEIKTLLPDQITDLKKMYQEMLLIRRFEEASAKAYAAGKIGGFCHLYIGQEAVGVGVINTLKKQDYILSTYRDHGHALARGCDPNALMAELYGRATGISRGKGGSMHFFDRERNFMGGHGIVGGHVALAAGIGWAIKYRGEKAAVVCFFGEGAANIGTFHESLNLASLYQLPVVFICENNQYSMGTPTHRSMTVDDVSIRGVAYHMTRDSMEGDDVLKVRNCVGKYVDMAREGEGPVLLEIGTYRFRGHSMSDPAKYRTREEVEGYKSQDPLNRARLTLEHNGVGAEELGEIENIVKEQVRKASEFAEESPWPDPSSLYENVVL